MALDLPTQLGFDSDAPEAVGEVGKVGVAIDSLADMETIFEGIPLDKVSTSFTINGTATILLAMYEAVAAKQGVARERIAGTMQNDLFKEFGARGAWIFPIAPSMRLVRRRDPVLRRALAALQPDLDRVALPRRRRHARRGDGLHALRRGRLRQGVPRSRA